MYSYVCAYITSCPNDLYMAMQDYRMTDNHVGYLNLLSITHFVMQHHQFRHALIFLSLYSCNIAT